MCYDVRRHPFHEMVNSLVHFMKWSISQLGRNIYIYIIMIYHAHVTFFSCGAKHSVLRLLCGDVSLNPVAISFGAVNCRSIGNKGLLIENTVSEHDFHILYTTPLSYVLANRLNISFRFYADDTQLYVHLTH